jgi:hypothetical protein
MADVAAQNMPPVYAYEHLSAMYPECYQKIYPVVLRTCEIYDVPTNPQMYPYPSRGAVYQMADSIYNMVSPEFTFTDVSEQQVGFGSRRLFRDLILILLISTLLRRRGTFIF